MSSARWSCTKRPPQGTAAGSGRLRRMLQPGNRQLPSAAQERRPPARRSGRAPPRAAHGSRARPWVLPGRRSSLASAARLRSVARLPLRREPSTEARARPCTTRDGGPLARASCDASGAGSLPEGAPGCEAARRFEQQSASITALAGSWPGGQSGTACSTSCGLHGTPIHSGANGLHKLPGTRREDTVSCPNY